MIDRSTIEYRDSVRCPVCGHPWETTVPDPKTGEPVATGEPAHPDDASCSQYRPKAPVPAWVLAGAKQLEAGRKVLDMGGSLGAAPLLDDDARARRELEGGPSLEFTNGVQHGTNRS